jgi:nucleoid-associated protein YgaU
MSVRRLVVTAAGMAGIAWVLAGLVPPAPEVAHVLAHPQLTVDTVGADTLVLAAVGLLTWLVWAWGTVGLILTAVSALPGFLGTAARTTLGVVLPAGARRSAALLLGVGLGVAGPFVATAWPTAAASAAVDEPLRSDAGAPDDEIAPDDEGTAAALDWPASTTPDWPMANAPGTTPSRGTVTDWLPTSASDEHVVVRGDCLWSIAEARLLRDHGRPPSAADVADAVAAWWSANDTVIGPDPDLLLPGQILLAPDTP